MRRDARHRRARAAGRRRHRLLPRRHRAVRAEAGVLRGRRPLRPPVERNAGISEQISILEKLERNAPKDVAADATFFLDTMREFQQGDEAARDEIREDPRVQEAVENVNRRAAGSCGFFESEPGDGS